LLSKTWPFAVQNVTFCSALATRLFSATYISQFLPASFFLHFYFKILVKILHSIIQGIVFLVAFRATALQRYICWNLHFNLHNTARSHAATLSHLLFSNVMNTAS
jgi:hypothetical protein